MSKAVETTCPYCGTGCGVAVRVTADGVAVEGDARHPSNGGRLCIKGAALGETLVPEGRLLYPAIRDAAGALRRVRWDAALDHVAGALRRIIDTHGPDAVAWYVSGQLLTEDYYVANKLVKGYVGTANIDTNSRLCMSSAVAGHKRAFGEDIVPVSYEDLEQADLVVLVGSNTAWCHPILYQRIVRAKERRPQMKVVVIDPRRTATTDAADLHLPLRAGTDVWLFNGLLSFLHQHGVVDTAFVDAHTCGFDRALAVADNTAGSVRAAAKACGLDESALAEFYRLFARTEKVITAFSMGVNQSSAGTDKVNSIINCHLLTGRIGKPGTGPFSLTGQPNAMGGREVGGLANMLAAHLDLENAQHRELVQTFWRSPSIAHKPGLKAVDLFDAIDASRVKAVWIMATNPVVSLPDADKVKRALGKCELVIVSDVMENTDTTAYAHVLLPALAWGEKDGTVTNSERRISRQRAFLPAPGEARPDWWALAEIGKRWGYADAFGYAAPHEIFDEHARLTAFGNTEALAPRYLNLAGLIGMSAADYDALAPVRWPVPPDRSRPTAHVFSDGRFYTPDRKARFVPTPPRLPVHARDDDYPLVLNTGRVRDHWHTMTRTGLSPRLASHIAEPYVDLHPQDALSCGVREGGLARVATRWGSLVARVRTSGELPRRSVFVPIHWNAQYASDARVGALVNPVVDPVSGEPEFKHTPVRVEEFPVLWHGFALSRRPLPMTQITWWTRITGRCFLRYEFAGRQRIADWPEAACRVLGVRDTGADWIEYEDRSAGQYRAAWVVDERIEACVFVSPRPDLPSRAWLSGLFAKDRLEELDRIGLLVGEPLDRGADTGPTVCSCFGVGRNTILDAIRTQGCTNTEALGRRLRCGTNCGSCIPELKALIAASALEPA
ncbi:molybdopterin-dependent oxidoreductase [Sinimarinibacterium thermocellulolyticum]|uniref:Molybdopterin-dependent oxidoreductase n=1 Tax=Sinimarinibacterium thermocellulolyticum TaxID=3170016 RepID=A0ABV2ACJ3_9GAMM